MRILIVEDEIRLAEALSQILKEEKYLVDAVTNGEDGLYYASSGEYDLVLLDVMLPRKNGFEVVRELRLQKCAVPVLMLTAKSEIPDKVGGLDCGADDYMTKPFSTPELLARIRALSRRQGEVAFEELSFADVTLGLSDHLLRRGEKSVHLGYKEFEVMRLLMANPKIILEKTELISKIWGAQSDAEDNNAEAYISFLRRKLCFLGSKVNIGTVRKVGYRLEVEET